MNFESLMPASPAAPEAAPVTARTLRARAARAARRGMSLVEVLIVLAIIALIAGGVAVVAVPKLEQARVDSAKTSMLNMRRAAEMFRADHPDIDCPTAQMLKQKKVIDAASDIKDPWGRNYEIQCDPDETYVLSFGKDGRKNTEDDLRVPAVDSAAE